MAITPQVCDATSVSEAPIVKIASPARFVDIKGIALLIMVFIFRGLV
jgi:hypothetical protein